MGDDNRSRLHIRVFARTGKEADRYADEAELREYAVPSRALIRRTSASDLVVICRSSASRWSLFQLAGWRSPPRLPGSKCVLRQYQQGQLPQHRSNLQRCPLRIRLASCATRTSSSQCSWFSINHWRRMTFARSLSSAASCVHRRSAAAHQLRDYSMPPW